VLAAVTLAASAAEGVPRSQRARKRVVNAAIKNVSEHLGNTPTVAAPPTSTRASSRASRRAAPCCRRCGGRRARPRRRRGRAVLERAVVELLEQ
jgi:hypothetical protein